MIGFNRSLSSSLSSGYRPVPFGVTIPFQELNHCLSLLTNQGVFEGRSVICELEKSLPEISMGRQKLQQVFINLLSNAIRHSPKDGRLKLALKPHGETVKFSLRDEGPGLSEDLQPK